MTEQDVFFVMKAADPETGIKQYVAFNVKSGGNNRLIDKACEVFLGAKLVTVCTGDREATIEVHDADPRSDETVYDI